jgi:hypothetical protein
MHEFKHPKYYKELRKLRNKSDQVISDESFDGSNKRASWSGPQATSFKLQASQASSCKRQAPSYKHQASSHKRQAPGFLNHGTCENDSRLLD